jgi:hypothetical protein
MLRVEDGLAVAQRAFFAQESGRRESNSLVNLGGAGRLYTINYKKHPDWDKEVLRLTKNGRGADKVLTFCSFSSDDEVTMAFPPAATTI